MQTIMEISANYNQNDISLRQPTPGKETELVRRFINYKKTSFHSTSQKHLMIFVEPKMNHSYPDIVFVEYDPEKFNDWAPTRNELKKTDYKILYYVYISRNLNTEDIVSNIGTSWKETVQAIERLYDSKLIYRKAGHWCPHKKNLFGTKKIEAVEAKINKVDEAYKQALQNQTFASESYILSNQKIEFGKNTHINKVKKAGIGLYTQGCADENFDTILRSNKKKIPASFSSIFFNEWVGKVIHS